MILSPNLPKDFFFVITKTDLSSSILKLPLDRVDLCVKGDDLVLGGHPVFDVSDFDVAIVRQTIDCRLPRSRPPNGIDDG